MNLYSNRFIKIYNFVYVGLMSCSNFLRFLKFFTFLLLQVPYLPDYNTSTVKIGLSGCLNYISLGSTEEGSLTVRLEFYVYLYVPWVFSVFLEFTFFVSITRVWRTKVGVIFQISLFLSNLFLSVSMYMVFSGYSFF